MPRPRRPRLPLAALGLEPRPDINPAALANLLPIVLYVGVRQFAGSQLAIGVALVVLIALFVSHRHVGVLRVLAAITLAVALVSGAVGLALESDLAFLLREPIGDLLAGALLLGSLARRRPLVGLIAHEVSPLAMRGQDLRLRLFYWLTAAWLGYVLATGGFRIFLLLEDLSPEAYLLWSRALSWPVSGILLGASVVLIARHVRARQRSLTVRA